MAETLSSPKKGPVHPMRYLPTSETANKKLAPEVHATITNWLYKQYHHNML